MSSSRPAEVGRRAADAGRPRAEATRRGRAWTLRARLLAMLILVLAAVCVAVGVTTAVVLRNNLIDQTDTRLDGARDRILAEQIDYHRPGGGPRGDPPSFL